MLWIVTRHARLTGDKDWLRQQWPKLEGAFNFICRLREQASKDPKALYYRLIPPGMSDGGVPGDNAEYTNVYWTLLGMRAAIGGARWLGKTEQADQWQREYDDFYAAFRKAAERDMQVDPQGNPYLPIVMGNMGHRLPQCAQWAFCHAVFPGKLFASDDPLVRGNMAMLQATEREGMVYGTGWMPDGIWGYFGSFYGHAWLWLGDGQKAARNALCLRQSAPRRCWSGVKNSRFAAKKEERGRHAAQLGQRGVHPPGAAHARLGARPRSAPAGRHARRCVWRDPGPSPD